MGAEKQDGTAHNDSNGVKATSFHHADELFSEQHFLSERT